VGQGGEVLLREGEARPVRNPDPTLAAAPYLDDPDANDLRVLKELRAAGVVDATEVSKKSVDYLPKLLGERAVTVAIGGGLCRKPI